MCVCVCCVFLYCSGRQATGATIAVYNSVINKMWMFLKEISSDGDVSTVSHTLNRTYLHSIYMCMYIHVYTCVHTAHVHVHA